VTDQLTAGQLAELSKMSKQTMNHAMVPTDQLAKLVAGYSASTMPQCVAELVEAMHSAYLAKFPELCGTRVEDRINAAIASVRAYYGSKP